MTAKFQEIITRMNQIAGRMDGIENFILHNPTAASAVAAADVLQSDREMLNVTFAIPAQTKEDLDALHEHLECWKKRRVLVIICKVIGTFQISVCLHQQNIAYCLVMLHECMYTPWL